MASLRRWPHHARAGPGQALSGTWPASGGTWPASSGTGPGPRGTWQASAWRERARSRLRQAVAFVRSAEPRSNSTRLAIALDIALAAAGTVAVLVTVAKTSNHSVVQVLGPANGQGYAAPVSTVTGGIGWQGALLATATTVPLAIRRLRPLTAFWVILAATLATPHYEANVITLIAVVLAAYSAVAYSRFRGVVILSLPAAAILISAAFPSTMPTLPAQGTALLVLIPIVIVGNAMHRWRQQAGDSRAGCWGCRPSTRPLRGGRLS